MRHRALVSRPTPLQRLLCALVLSITALHSAHSTAQTASDAGLVTDKLVTDDTGQELHFKQAPQRIIALSPSITENLFAIGAGSRVVGVSSYSDYPQEAKNLPIVSDYQNIDLEAIVKLKPDVVVVWQGGQSPAQLNALKQLNIPIFYQQIHTLADIPLSLMRLSQMMGNQREAAPLIANAYAQIPLLAQAPQPRLNAFYQVWPRPLMTINGRSWISDALARCGAHNLFADLPITAPTVNVEDVLTRQPDLILSTTPRGQTDDSLDFWRAWPHLPAVAHKGLIYTEGDALNRSTLRTLAAAERLCRQIEPVRTTFMSQK